MQNIEATIIDIENRVFEALKNKDADALDTILAPEFVLRNATGTDLSRSQFLNQVRTLPVQITAIGGENLRADVYGSHALLTGLQKATVVDMEGNTLTSVSAFADLFIETADGWKLAWAHNVDLPSP